MSVHTPLAAGIDDALLAHEAATLPASTLLCESGDLVVRLARADQIPATLFEIGRQRERTFRAAGEGTGREVDLDRFDSWYLHLWVADRQTGRVVGAYRLGRGDRILDEQGPDGLYTHSLFHLDEACLEAMRGSVELGRSFVVPEHQGGPALASLWRGIGAFLVERPHYRRLVGATSIDRNYSDETIQLVVDWSTLHRHAAELAPHVRPRRPWAPTTRDHGAWARIEADDRPISLHRVVKERDPRGIPVLLKHYLGLGARIAAFNVDPDFSDVVDALIVTELSRVEPRRLARFMGAEGAAWYLKAA